MRMMTDTFKNLLLDHNIISPDQWRVAMVESQQTNSPIQETLIQSGFVSEAVLVDLHSQEEGIHPLDLEQVIFDPAITHSLPRAMAGVSIPPSLRNRTPCIWP